MNSQPLTKLAEVEARLGADWMSIRAARAARNQRRVELEKAFAAQGSSDTSLVVFGSVAREEVTSGSDLDWILLIDGQSVPEHKKQERAIERTLVDGHFIKPGSSGVFGKMVGSHDLVHNMGAKMTSIQTHAASAFAPRIVSSRQSRGVQQGSSSNNPAVPLR
jgi:predicted nucleotidyltransferase